MNTEEKLLCNMCCMEISAKAKKCPYCQHWQNKWLMAIYNPLFTLLYFCIFGVGFAILWGTMMNKMFAPGEQFENHKDSVQIKQAEMKFGNQISCKGAQYPIVAILGKLHNNSNISWKEVVIEVQIFNQQKAMIDTKQQDKYNFLVPAKGETAFKLSFEMQFPKEEYHSFQVFVRSAKDERKRF